MVGKNCLGPSPKHTVIYNRILQGWPKQSAAYGLTEDKVRTWIEVWQKNNKINDPDKLPAASQLVRHMDYMMKRDNKTPFSQLGNENPITSAPNDIIDRNSITSQLIAELRAQGITIHNRAELIQYLQRNGDANIQQVLEENREMQAIKEKAIADGIFMKAPNGKPTKLNEKQWLQVRTKNFINWFGDWINDPANASKVVDENGEPLVVYHHTDNPDLTKFSTDFDNYFSKYGGTRKAIFFDEEKTGTLNRKYDIPVFLNIRDLNEYNETKQQLHDRDTTYREVVNQSAEKNDVDGGVHMKDFDDNKKEHQSIWIVHNPNQIKSATDNIGTFSTENDDIQMFIGKKARTQFEQQLRKARPDMSDTEIQATLDFLHSLEDNKENTAYIKTAIRWVANRSITLPQDNTKARQAFDLARKKNIDLQKYATLGELIASDEIKPKEKEKKAFNPDEAKTFSNKRTVTTEGGRTFTVYDVENTDEGQREVCKALAAHYKMSPWCLSTFTATGEPTESAKHYWGVYSALPRKIAFENGKPVAFNSDKSNSPSLTFRGQKVIEFINSNRKNKIGFPIGVIPQNAEQLVSEGIIFNIYEGDEDMMPTYRFTDKGEKLIEQKEVDAWWDMEDRYPQDTLSDSIVSEVSPRTIEDEAADALIEDMLANTPPEDYTPPVPIPNIPLHDELDHYSDEFLANRLLDTNIEQYERDVIQNILNYRAEHRNDEDYLPFFKTPQGEVYGFISPSNEMYLDETVISPEHPIHEYTHLWDRIIAKNNPKLWQQGIKLLKNASLKLPGHDKSLWQEIEDNPNYGQRWQKIKESNPSQYESLIASEVHARLVGENGAKLLDDIAKQSKSANNIIQKLKQWILEAWKNLKATFSDWTEEELNKLTLADFNHMTVRDFATGALSPYLRTSPSQTEVDFTKREASVNSIRNYYRWQQNHVTFDKKTHTYYYDGKKVDYSVTQYKDAVYGTPGITGDYSHSTAMGNDVDALTRDFFEKGKDPSTINYPNLNEERKNAIIKDLQRLKKFLDKKFEGNYQVITSEIPLVGKMTVNGKEKTIAGTPDMIIIDGNGDVHLLDMKVKVNSINSYNNRRDYTFQLNAYRDLIESIFPEFKGKVKDLNLIWFDTEYPKQGREARFSTNNEGVVTVSDTDVTNQLLSEYSKWKTPALKANVEESLIPLNQQQALPNVSPVDSNWKKNIAAPAAQIKPNSNAVLENFKKNINTLRGYFEGSAPITQILPNLSDASIRVLGNYFMGGIEPTLEQYRQLWNEIEFVPNPDPNDYFKFIPRERQQIGNTQNPKASFGFNSQNTKQQPQPSVVSQAPSVASTPEEIKEPESVAFNSALKEPDSRTQQFYTTFTPQQIKDRGAMIADMFSSIVDDYIADELEAIESALTDPEKSETEKENLRIKRGTYKDPITGRQQAIRDFTIGRILEKIISRLELSRDSADEASQAMWQNIIDFFEELFNSQASLDIEEQEGVRIIGLEFTEKSTAEDEQDDESDGNDETGHTVSGNDGWIFQARFENPFNSLSKRVKRLLYNVERPNNEKDDLGYTRKYPMGQIYASLLSYLSANMQSPDDFIQVTTDFSQFDPDEVNADMFPIGYPTFPALEKMRDKYPWVSQLIERLTMDYMNPEYNTDLRYPSTYGAVCSQFYTNFRKAMIPYGKIQVGKDENGNDYYGVTPMNYDMEERCQLDKLKANYNNGFILTPTSIYNSDTTVNREHAKQLIRMIDDATNDNKVWDMYNIFQLMKGDVELEKDDVKNFNDYIDNVHQILMSFGIGTRQDRDNIIGLLAQREGGGELSSVLSELKSIADNIAKLSDENVKNFNYILDNKLGQDGGSVWNNFFSGRGFISDVSYIQSFYDSATKKTKYSYSVDNYLQKMFRSLYEADKSTRQAFMDEHFKKFEWFYNHTTNTWRNKWLEKLYNADTVRKGLPYRNIDSITEYPEKSFDPFGFSSSTGETKTRSYTDWKPEDIWLVQGRNYDTGSDEFGFYLAPIFSDSPMSMTVRGPKLSIDELVDGFINLIDQEMWRIKYVSDDRAEAIKKGIVNPIANFDGKRGKQFCFIPELNDYTFPDGKKFLEKIADLKERRASEEAIVAAEKKALYDILNSRFNDYLEENRDKYPKGDKMTQEMKEAEWQKYLNMAYANISIIQITNVDLAFSKDSIDFQKRFKEVYAGGIQLNTNSRYGEKYENVAIIKDDTITSPSYTNIKRIVEAIPSLTDKEKKEILKAFKNINVADAQAYRSMWSYRSIMDMMGNWSERQQEAMEHFQEGTWNKEDFDIIYQTIKPFVFAVVEKNDGMGKTIAVPQQHKNSEICMLMMYDIITKHTGMNNSPVYRALSRFMDQYKGVDGKPLIHMIQHESASKKGTQGVVNISFHAGRVMNLANNGVKVGEDNKIEFNLDKPNTLENVEDTYKKIKERLDLALDNGTISQEQYKKVFKDLRPDENEIVDILEQHLLIKAAGGNYTINPETVTTIPFDNYYQAQPTPEHHIDAEAIVGSQARNITVADIPENLKLTLKGKKGSTKTFKGRNAIIDFYYELFNENLIESFFGDGKKNKGLRGIFESKASLRDAIENIVRGNPKYGRDFTEAIQLNEDGDFVLSPNSPTMFHMMQDLITSFFKNNITKQKINGASLIQTAGIGLDSNLRVLFDEKSGKPTGAECYMPLTSKRFFEPFLKTDAQGRQYLDGEAMKKAGLERAFGYRIPTENTSSMLPLYIKGFTPMQNGSVIVLPAEITALAGSDFDVDKMFLMLLSFRISNYRMHDAIKDFAEENLSEAYDIKLSETDEEVLLDDVYDELIREGKNHELWEDWWEEEVEEGVKRKDTYKKERPKAIVIEYDFSKSPKENGRMARNNMLIQMYYELSLVKNNKGSLFNPQGFPDVEKAAKIMRILTDPNLKEALLENYVNDVQSLLPPVDEIKRVFLEQVREKDPNNISKWENALSQMSDAQIQAAYAQNIRDDRQSIERLLLNSDIEYLEDFIKKYSKDESPIYPQTFAHAHKRNMAGKKQLSIYAVQGSMAAKFQRANVRLKPQYVVRINGRPLEQVDISDGGRTLKNVNQMVGASADNGKKPNLTDMGSTDDTAPIIGYLLRLGMSHIEAALVINQPEFAHTPIIQGVHQLPNVTSEMLVRNLLNPGSLSEDELMAIAALCQSIKKQHEAMEYVTQVSRADSPNGAMANSFAKARIQQYKVDLLQAKMSEEKFPFYRINEALSNTAIDVREGEDVVRDKLKKQPMGLLHGMYALGINSLSALASPYFYMLTKHFDDNIVKPILYNMSENLSDAEKEELIDSLYNEYITFILSGTDLFGNEENSASMKSKRAYYTEKFADDFAEVLQNNPDINDLIGSFLQRDGKRVVLKDIGSLDRIQKEEISRRITMLLYGINPNEPNSEAKKLAKKLLMFSYYDSGINFRYDSYSPELSTQFLILFSSYVEALNSADEQLSKELEDNFKQQYLITHDKAVVNMDTAAEADCFSLIDDDTIQIDRNAKDKNLFDNMLLSIESGNKKDTKVYEHIRFRNRIFVLDKEAFEANPASAIYHALPQYDTSERRPLYSMQMTVNQLATEFPIVNIEQSLFDEETRKDNVTRSNNTMDTVPPPAPDMFSDPVFDSRNNSSSPVDYGGADVNWGEFTAFDPTMKRDGYETKSTAQQYTEEGNYQLKDPMCSTIK